MVASRLWRELGGFDAHFAPAYCEDADLAFRVRAKGLRVWFQPQSRVIHYEGKTSGTDTREGVKAYQVTNAKKLFLRWRLVLEGHRRNGEAPFLERERRVTRRALIVDASAPTPKQDAGSVTTTLTLRLFQQLGYKAHFVPQDNFLFQPEYTTDLQATGVDVAYAPYEVGFDNYIRRYGWSFDVVLVYRVGVLEQVLSDLRRHAPQACVLFHNMDLHFLRMERQARQSDDAAGLVAAAEMKTRELALIGQVDCTITHSTYERDLLAAERPGAPVVVWPFMFEFHGTEQGFARRRDFVFLGGYRHAPNVDAVRFFADEVLPLIHAVEPEARFIVAGANPGPEVLALANDHVIVTGLVDDLRTVFDTARVFACSLRIGAGTKGKVSTAMAYGLPVVSTACGAEGMDLVDGEEVLLADSPADFAAACLRLYRDPALWGRLSEAGMRLVQEKHSLAMGRRVLDEAIEQAWRHKMTVA
jgi:glycosyltransferase involved in cell wall biosynthesis